MLNIKYNLKKCIYQSILLCLRKKKEIYANEPDVHLSEKSTLDVMIENLHNSKKKGGGAVCVNS